MKLLRYTHLNLSVLLFLLLGGWGIFFYYTIIDEVMDETDDALANYRDIIVGKILADSSLLLKEDEVMHSYSIRPLTAEEASSYREQYYDGTVYIETEDEYEPVRIMKSCFMATDLNYYELELRLSTLERDDSMTAIIKHLVARYLVLLCCISFGTRLILKSVFRPLDRLLAWLENVVPGHPAPHLDPDCRIREFRTLNRAALDMHERAEKAYREQKEFIENASHELQTPLAIVNGKLELLSENENLNEEELKTIDDMFRSLHRAIQLNKSLLLLSRIQNHQFDEAVEVDMNRHVREILELMSDLYEAKELDCHLSDTEACRFRMNESLAHTLLNNLIKNAFLHSPDHGRVDVLVCSNRIEIANDGTQPLDDQQIFRRFYKGNARQKESTGLGLAIAQSIASLCSISLTYHHDGRHHFVLKFTNT